ncbi:MAG: hypothetical protein C4B59_10285 [Candidatus Methanogaster sp.]|uniref:Uncharacterized protein n=1 Tax=Candidatus Methanogaster sp. TaxID=3386292 RepID=A0AC61L1S6_9EURY|nr:MAG: hypothetical protein C4B59_10285 [ANME-2 cluster archaeon]
MKHYILAIVLLFSLAAPAMAAELTVDQISYEEMWINGTEFGSSATVTLSTSTNISVTPSSGAYSYEITGMDLPAGSVLVLNASPVDDLKLYVKKNWLVKYTFTGSAFGIISFSNPGTDTVRVECSGIPQYASGTLQTIRVYGTTTSSNVNLSVAVQQNVTADGSGNFSELVDISAIPSGVYIIGAIDDDTPPSNNTTTTIIYAPGQLHHIRITDPDTSELTRNTTGTNRTYTFNATGYDLKGQVVQKNVVFVWWSSNPYAGTIISTGYFDATNVGHTEVYAKSGAKESNHVIVYVNAPMNNTTLISEKNFTLESGNANVTGTFNRSVNGTITVQAIGNVTAETTTAGLGDGYKFVSGAVVNVSGEAHGALVAGNCTVIIKLCVSNDELQAMGLARSNVQIYVYNGSAWIGLTTTRIGTTDCYTADISGYLSEAILGIGSKPTPSSGGDGGGGSGGTYPPGWFGTTTTPVVSPTTTSQQGMAPTPVGEHVAPTPTRPAAAGATQAAPAKETPTKKKSTPGFPAVFAIAGMLAIAYMVLRQRR